MCKLAQYQDIDVSIRSECEVKVPDMVDSDLKAVLDEIFAVDPISGFPQGDIQYFLSKNGNPQVKAWLETNLLSPRAKQSGTSLEGVTDDFIAEYARNDGESVHAYAERLKGYYDSAKAEFEKLNVKQE